MIYNILPTLTMPGPFDAELNAAAAQNEPQTPAQRLGLQTAAVPSPTHPKVEATASAAASAESAAAGLTPARFTV
jgi:hypothetical protein